MSEESVFTYLVGSLTLKTCLTSIHNFSSILYFRIFSLYFELTLPFKLVLSFFFFLRIILYFYFPITVSCSLIPHFHYGYSITLPTKVCLVKAMVFPIVMYGCESWTIKKAKHWRIDAFELWCWRRLLRVPWTTGRSTQSILKENNDRDSK